LSAADKILEVLYTEDFDEWFRGDFEEWVTGRSTTKTREQILEDVRQMFGILEVEDGS
jgi:hypothetical protein